MPAPYISQEEQRATPRIEKPPEPTPGLHDLWVLVAVVIILVLFILVFSGFFL